MKGLVRLIGPAPSELSFEEFLGRLLSERQRVVNSLVIFRSQPPKAKKAKRASTKKRTTQTQKAETMRALEDKAKEMGLSVEEMLEALTTN